MDIINNPPASIVEIISDSIVRIQHPMIKTRDQLIEANEKLLLVIDDDIHPIQIEDVVFNKELLYIEYKGLEQNPDFEGMVSIDLTDPKGSIAPAMFVNIEWVWDELVGNKKKMSKQ